MRKKLFLTSVLVMAVVPAFATTNTVAAANWTGTMAADTTYENSAIHDNIGVYSGGVTAEAYYSWELHTVTPGYYWPHGVLWENVGSAGNGTICPAGSYCVGATNVHYDETNDQTIASCSAFGNEYTSAAGASAANKCYRPCLIANYTEQEIAAWRATLGPVTELTGNDYYSDGVDTCEAYACANGYHVQAGSSGGGALVDLNNEIAAVNGVRYGAVRGSNGELVSQASAFGLTTTDLNKFAVQYNEGTVMGHARCSTQSGTGMWNGANAASDVDTISDLPDNAGRHCWCQLDSWTPNNGSSLNLSAIWGYHNGPYTSPSVCDTECARSCADYMLRADSRALGFRSAMFNTVTIPVPSGPTFATCQPNEITITWRGAVAANIPAAAASTVYAGDIVTPTQAEHQAGKSFAGWRFLRNGANGEPTSTPVTPSDTQLQSTPTLQTSDPVLNGTYMPYVAPQQ